MSYTKLMLLDIRIQEYAKKVRAKIIEGGGIVNSDNLLEEFNKLNDSEKSAVLVSTFLDDPDTYNDIELIKSKRLLFYILTFVLIIFILFLAISLVLPSSMGSAIMNGLYHQFEYVFNLLFIE